MDELVQEWRGQKALMPFYLCRMQQRANTLLRRRAPAPVGAGRAALPARGAHR